MVCSIRDATSTRIILLLIFTVRYAVGWGLPAGEESWDL